MTIKRYIILALSALTLAGCSNDDEASLVQERLPLTFETSLSGSSLVTRAAGSTIEADDKLLCYVRHIADQQADPVQSKLVTIINDAPTEPLYWDDFSESTADGAKDLRTSGHGLQSFYGYCYNGGTPTVLDEATGVLGWTTAADQTTTKALKENDLLWSDAQSMITYQHAKDKHGTLTVPFYHAMSKFTIVVVLDKGFQADDLATTTVTLAGMNLNGTFTAPDSTVTATGTTPVKMYANAASTTEAGKPCRTYEAVAVPLTALTDGKLLATIQSVDGNDYEVVLNSDVLNSWQDGIKNNASISGVNYKLTVTLNKQAISLVATLADWTDVSAETIGEINFTADVKTIDKTNNASLKAGDSFSLWRSTDDTEFGTMATTATYDGSKFVNTTIIYWPNGSTNYYFRALAQKTNEKTLEAVTTMEAHQGTDLLWATTAAHTGTEADGTTTHDYAEGDAINPRTGDVPLVFKHVMSNVKVELKTSSDASAVDLTDATVTMTNLKNKGEVSLATGVVTAGTTKATIPVEDETIMVPQHITDASRLVITLKDGTTYSVQLNLCEDDTQQVITKWLGGNKYTYTITLTKEAIQFRALIKDWTENTGSGNATLDWD
ncbi:fimbrillin family protein [Xylanibacter brevis]|uniref:fimbrillin family protein n=1 Tax=Xylanibacter brevis TaxID=83231 RepID=UPI00048688B2|nr:fimbrillin family protein [Xylanibacter brevis]